MEALRQDVQQEAADELAGGERHGAPALGSVETVILLTEDDAALVERGQPPVRDRDPMRIARQVGEHGLRTGVDDPSLLAERYHEPPEG